MIEEHIFMIIIFWLSFIMIAYTYLGYPAIVYVISTIRPKKIIKDAQYKPPVTIIVVAHNEQETIARKIESCLNQNYTEGQLKILIATDGSTDCTDKEVMKYGEQGVKLVSFPTRRGKAACIDDIKMYCDTDIIVFSDARQQLEPNAVTELVQNLSDPLIGAVSGELVFIRPGETEFTAVIDSYWRYEKFIRRCESQFGSVVGVTGALYAVRKSLLETIPEETIVDDLLIPLNVVKQGYRVVFEPRALAYDQPSKEPSKERRRKTRTIAGNYQLIVEYPWLLHPVTNPVWFSFISHKVLRLLGPVFMVANFMSAFLMFSYSVIYSIVFILEVMCILVVVAVYIHPNLNKNIGTKIISAFFYLNWYAVLGLLEYIRNKKVHIWK